MEEMDATRRLHHGRGSGRLGRYLRRHQRFYDKYGPDRVKDTPSQKTPLSAARSVRRWSVNARQELMTINFAFGNGLHRQPGAKLRCMFGGTVHAS